MPTMSAHMQLLRPGEHTLAHRQVGSKIYTAAKGSGTSIVAGCGSTGPRATSSASVLGVAEHANNSQSEMPACFVQRLPGDALAGVFREEAYPTTTATAITA